MLRWLTIAIIALMALGGYMAWRTDRLVSQPAHAVTAIAQKPIAVDAAAAASRLGQAIQFKTFANADGAARDPQAFEAFIAWIAANYPSLLASARAERVGAHSLLFTWQGSDAAAKPIILVAHLDVAPSDEGARANWSVDPYAGVRKDGAVWGRGALLGKAPLIAILEACEQLARAGFKPKRTILLALGEDGDVRGERGAAQIARLLEQRGVKAWFALDEGTPIVDRLVLTGKRTALIGVTEKRELDLVVTADGAGGSAAIRGRASITSVSQAIVALNAMPNLVSLSGEPTGAMLAALTPDFAPERAFLFANTWLSEPLIAFQVQNTPGAPELFSTTVQPTVLAAGAGQSQVPGAARALLNVRIHPNDSPAAFLARARAIVSPFRDVRLAWARKPDPRPPIASHSSAAYGLIGGLAATAAGGATVAPSLYIGSTDARRYARVADDVYRFVPAIWTDDDIRSLMGANEHLSEANLERMIKFYEQLLMEGAG